MTKKRFRKGNSILIDFPTGAIIDEETGERYYDGIKPSYISSKELVKILNELHEENQYLKSLKWNQDCIKEISIGMQQRQLLEEENEQLKKDVEYWKQVASKYTNLNVFERNCKKYKTECKDIHWSSD